MKLSEFKLKRMSERYTQKELAFVTGISQQKLSLIERGLVPNIDEAIRIANALSTTPKKLFKIINHK